MSDRVPDAAVWADATRGDPQAVATLIEPWIPVTLQWCRRLGGASVDAEQAAQDVMIVVLQRLHTVRERERFGGWVYSVTRKVLARHRRAAWVRLRGSAELDTFAGGLSPHRQAVLSERAQRVQELLEALDEPLREVLVLCELEERTDAEVAALLDIPVGTVKSRLRRARVRFGALASQSGLSQETA